MAVAGGPYGGVEGVAIAFDGSGSYDLDGDPLSYSWDFGDGSFGSGASPSHAYVASGTYTVTLTVNDGTVDSPVSSTSAIVDPAGGGNQAPVAVAGGPYGGVEGVAIAFDGSGSYDLDGDPLSYSWDFGDGSFGSGASPSHAYVASGTYTVTLTVNDGTVDSPVSSTSASVSASGGTGAFQQDSGSGLVSIEAEHFAANIVRSNAAWAGEDRSGSSGGAALIALPTSAPTIGTGYSASSPQLDYPVNFSHTGTHYIWIRGYASSTSSNSVHMGLDGVEVSSAGNIVFSPAGSYQWVGGPGVASFDVTTLGVHSVNVWMRESGFIIDKIVITPNAGYVQPSGSGPAESPRDSVFASGLFSDEFNDGNILGWTMVSECESGSPVWTVAGNALHQLGDCRGFAANGAAVGTYLLSDNTVPANADLRVSVRADSPSADGVGYNDSSTYAYDVIGLMFGYQDSNNYYRFELDGAKGHRKLWRKQGGVFTELNTSPQSYTRDTWTDLRVVHRNGVILMFVDGQRVLAVADSAFSSGKTGLFCARNAACRFDDVHLQSAPATPMIGISFPDGAGHASSEYFVDTDATLNVQAVATGASGVGGVEFVVDEGAPGQVSISDMSAPYTAQFNGLSNGDHTVTGYLLDSGGVRLAGSAATVTLGQVGTGGIHLHSVGDSLTNGQEDDVVGDDVSADGRNTGGGYEPILNDLLSAANPVPVTVRNDGNNGETSAQGVDRIDEVLSHSPEAQAYVVMYGANDSGDSVDPGLGLSPGQAGYAGSFKANMQAIIDAVLAEGKTIFLVKTSPYLNSASRNATILVYNQVIDELVSENGFTYTPADAHSYFTANPGEMAADGIHLTGVGYASLAGLICQMVNGHADLTCIP